MTKRIIFILLAVFWGLGLQAQTVEKDGTYYYDAIPVTFDIGTHAWDLVPCLYIDSFLNFSQTVM